MKHRSRRYFLIRNACVWAAFGAAVVLGAVSISAEEAVIERGILMPGFLFRDLSFLWIAATVLFVALAFLNLRLTTEGYRYRAAWIVLGILLVAAMLGLLFHHEGIGDHAEAAFEHSSFQHFWFGP